MKPGGLRRDAGDVLKQWCERELASRFGGDTPGGHKNRLAYELSVIGKLGYSEHFLKLAGIAAFIKRKGLRMSPGWGAAPSSLACWVLGITHVDPLHHELLFERFLNLNTKVFPYVRFDVTPSGREHVLSYLRKAYGTGNVALVGCIGRRQGPKGEEIIRGIDVAAVCVSDRPLQKQIPLRRGPRRTLVTEDTDDVLRAKGLFIVDLLPWRALMKVPGRIVAKGYTTPIPKTFFQRLCREDTKVVLGLDSAGMQPLIKGVQPESLAHVAALTALFRPGPFHSGLVDRYIERRHQKGPIRYYNLTLMDILEETYGLILYQEQIMAIAMRIAGFSPEMADALRKAMGKKIAAALKDFRRQFIERCRPQGTSAEARENAITKEDAGKLFDTMEQFGGYAFSKSHAVAIGILACLGGQMMNEPRRGECFCGGCSRGST